MAQNSSEWRVASQWVMASPTALVAMGAAGWKQDHGQAAFSKLMGLKWVLGSYNAENFTIISWHSTVSWQFTCLLQQKGVADRAGGSHHRRDMLGACDHKQIWNCFSSACALSRAHKPNSVMKSLQLTVKSREVKAPTTTASVSRQAKPPEPSPNTEARKEMQTLKALLWPLPRIL